MKTAEPEVASHEPHSALAAGADGMDDLRILLAGANAHLAQGGLLALETGIAQGEAWRALAQENDLSGEVVEDFSQRPRFFFAQAVG